MTPGQNGSPNTNRNMINKNGLTPRIKNASLHRLNMLYLRKMNNGNCRSDNIYSYPVPLKTEAI